MTDPIETPPQPLFNAPWPALTMALAIVATYAAQSLLWGGGAPRDLALSPAGLAAGQGLPLITSIFLHGSWPHAILNAVAALAFGAPVARLMGWRPVSALAFLLFFIVCGVAGSLGYVALHQGEATPLVGASGAVSGLMGAASRLMDRRGLLGPITSPSAVGMGIAWVVVNAIVALTGFAPGAGGMQVAWEAHIAGFVAGLVLIGPFARALGRA